MKLKKLAALAVKPESKDGPLVVNIGSDPATGMRRLTIDIPQEIELTEAYRRKAEEEAGQDALAVCDITGQLIFKKKNINEVVNPERPEVHGLTISTALLTALLAAVKKNKPAAAPATSARASRS